MDRTELIEILQANHIRKGTYILINDVVCKVDDYHTAKTGKHGSAKMLIKAVELVSGKQKETTISTADRVEVPIINRKEYVLVDLDDDFMQLLNEKGEMIENIKLNANAVSDKLRAEFGETVNAEFTITVLHFMNQTLVDDYKVKKNG